MEKATKILVRWEELLPEEFRARQEHIPLVYLPIGICEPHGHIAPFGLDTLKANYLCEEAAKRFGGIVAPTLGYQIHESGYHAQWLEEVVGEINPYMTAMPPDVLLRFFLYQLRAFANAGFQYIFALTGHAGGNQEDLRLVAEEFMNKVDVKIIVKADPELVSGKFDGDHAGKYEISQLLYLRPDLMAMKRLGREKSDALGRFAQGEDAAAATSELGKQIIEASLSEMEILLHQIATATETTSQMGVDYHLAEKIWESVLRRKKEWVTTKPREGQSAVSKKSQWLPYENC